MKRRRLRALADVIRTAYRAAPLVFVASLIMEPLGFAAEPFIGFGMKRLTDAALAHDSLGALAAAGVFTLVLTAMLGLQGVGVRSRLTLDEKVKLAYEERMAGLLARIPGLEAFERPDLQDRLQLLREKQAILSHGTGMMVVAAGHVLRLATALVLLASVQPLLLLLLGLGMLPSWLEARGQRLLQRAEEAAAEPRRRAQSLLHAAAAPAAAKEVRIFSLAEELRRQFLRSLEEAGRTEDRGRRAHARLSLLGWLAFGAGYAGAVAWVVWQAASGRATPGDVVMTVYLANSVAGHVSNASWAVQSFMEVLRITGYLEHLEDHEAEARQRPAPAPAPQRLREGIRLEDVRFRYPGTETEVLAGCSAELPAGAVVALVGENGAGKSTIVKLLLGMYRPDGGRITVDGADLAGIPVEEWRRRCAAAFQDFARLELPVREAVGVGALELLTAGERLDAEVERALRAAGGWDVVEALPEGLATMLGRTWGGTDLSGGQWQKLALGRAMMREEPLLLVLDEPTASLDAETEYALFQRYAGIARGRRAFGGITLFVSHRFSTVRMADLILVLDRGRIVESGSHAQLMAMGGLYAELFELQARAYR
ncbi:MAG: ABC transporter ATP-binding protein [Firmicutes bacterium]|nr:ABC transporter ATP-binding protein [Bacillota bacterium]